MILAAVASLLLAAGQTPPPDPAPPPEEHEQAADGPAAAALETSDETTEPITDAGEVIDVRGIHPNEDEDSGMVCRRQSYYDDFGRQRSRKSCRPRD